MESIKEVISKVESFKIIYSLRNKFSISLLCDISIVSRSGYYKWCTRKKQDKNTFFIKKILSVYKKSKKEEIKNCKSVKDLVGKNGLMKRLFKDVMQQLLDTEMEELYGIELSPSAISHITDKVLGAVAEWQNRMLDKVYPIVYMDGVHFKVREDNKIVSKAAYVCLGIDINGYKDILGIWIGESEGAKFWLSVCND